tara:strand:- start:6808 stop:7698 length:891 start_codon:yes stop_codon:yes gene_type:complete
MGLLTQNQEQYYLTNSPDPFGDYQFISIKDIINNFIVGYVGEDKIIPKISKSDIRFHAMRGLQELSYDTLNSIKSQEIELPPSLTMILPQDYVNYVKLTWSDGNGIEHVIYPAIKTSNPLDIDQQASGVNQGDYLFDGNADLQTDNSSTTWENYQGNNSDIDTSISPNDYYVDSSGQRFGIDPQHAQGNGSFYIDPNTGLIHFSSNISGKTVILKYISDSLGTDKEMKVHKLAEDALYKHIAHAVLNVRANTDRNMVAAFKKERSAAIRNAKLRLSNIKLEELTQIIRGRSKWIKH